MGSGSPAWNPTPSSASCPKHGRSRCLSSGSSSQRVGSAAVHVYTEGHTARRLGPSSPKEMQGDIRGVLGGRARPSEIHGVRAQPLHLAVWGGFARNYYVELGKELLIGT